MKVKFNNAKLKSLIDFFAAKGLTKEALSVKLNISFSTIYKWTKGETVPGADTLHAILDIAKEYGCRTVTFESFFEK